MTKSELIGNLGTIGRSGSAQFLDQTHGTTRLSLIGRFGIGFYSAFALANRVQVFAKHNHSEHQYLWESDGGGTFTVKLDASVEENERLTRGTKVVLHVKREHEDLLNSFRLRTLVTNRLQFIKHPIEMFVKDPNWGISQSPPSRSWSHSNKQYPIWYCTPSTLSLAQYATFYLSVTGEFAPPLAAKHFLTRTKSSFDLSGLIFLPKWFHSGGLRNLNFRLCVRRVLLASQPRALVPDWLSFVTAVVNSENLPLHISREFPQQPKFWKVIREAVTENCLEMLLAVARSSVRGYLDKFALYLKVGFVKCRAHRSKIVELLRFFSSRDETTSLREYVNRMPEHQSSVYYIIGPALSRDTLRSSPFVQICRKMRIEVLLLTDAIDAYVVLELREYGGKELVPIDSETFLAQRDVHHPLCVQMQGAETLCELFKGILGKRVESVVVAHSSFGPYPCHIVSDFGWNPNLAPTLRAKLFQQSGGNLSTDQPRKFANKTLVVNPNAAVIQELVARILAGRVDEKFEDIVRLLCDVALVQSGFEIADPNEFALLVHRLLLLWG
eukprot:c28199_g1_i1.p1 GENE.c28199_g1_i1~~c28199_g1_i1.p1  ORF type:complete len:555 (-),score=110.10 c28199_g1_i1:16-1680(-)